MLLGFNEVTLKDEAEVLATVSSEYGSLPLLVTGRYGKGRTVAWTSDVGPHWLPPEFIAWKGYKTLFEQMLELGDRRELSYAVHVVGNACVDTTFRLGRFPSAGETLNATTYGDGLGGKGANQAVAARARARR